MLVRPARRDYRTWILDSRRWGQYRPRSDDIVIATYPKCGTTWMQRIVGLLIFQSPEPLPVMQISPWIDRRFPEPIEAVLGRLDAQEHRRFLKAHLPADGLPIYDDVKYVHVARDGRDACMSFHNHGSGFTPRMLEDLDRAGLADESVGRPYPRVPADPEVFFHRWLTEGAVPGNEDGLPTMSFFHCERTWWAERHRPNVLLVHFNDLKADLAGEMWRLADFLGIAIDPDLWPSLVEAAGFEAMRRSGAALMGRVAESFRGGADHFFHKGTNERWRSVFRDEDLSLYEIKAAAMLSSACAQWVAAGRLRAGDPRLAAD
ncbi:sulfotransferase domain-containing protein [Dongia deserti]|uniref:sulfotransferase domain-containing protein n=1 Tax=Dongia deserti TaxID=2268030 RepID=UPI000E64B1F1|nr:sulfotransferase domain-containing protein [Dongia deserti]